MKNTIFQTPVCKLKELNNLFIELTEKNCNQRCKHCYIDFPLNKNVKDFIKHGIIKENAAVYATHIATSPEFFTSDEAYQQYLNENCGGVPVLTYDGLKVEL